MPATPGGTDYQAYYDPNLNVTWLADVQLPASNTFGLPVLQNFGPYPGDTSGAGAIIDSDGDINWPAALFFIDAMNASNGGDGYLGFNDWRMPRILPINGNTYQVGYSNNATTDRGYAPTTTDGSDGGWRNTLGVPTSELGFLYYVTLGNLSRCPADDTNPTSCDSITVSPDWAQFNIDLPTGLWSGNELPFDEICGNGVDDDLDGIADRGDPDCEDGAVQRYIFAWSFMSGSGEQRYKVGKSGVQGLMIVRDGDTEICDNGADDDGDGLVDREDPDCAEVCDNGLDDDGDNLIDREDPDCQEICDNGVDDDNDGLIDQEDNDCIELCANGIDDNGDGLIDGEDPQCAPEVGLLVRCIHQPLWPEDGEQVQIEVEAIDASGTAVRADRVEIYIGSADNPPVFATGSTARQAFTQATGRSLRYSCNATLGEETAFSGWREVDVGEPEFTEIRAVPVIFNGGWNEKIDILFIPESNRHQLGPNGYELFQEDIYRVIKEGIFGVPGFVRHQDQFNFWLARDFGSVVDKDPDGRGLCKKIKPDNFAKDYGFAEAGGIIHAQDCRDNASLKIFTTGLNANRLQVVSHEIGHAAFSLSDEYQGSPTFYFSTPPFANLFPTRAVCRSAASARGYNPDDCRELVDAAGFIVLGRWIFEPDYSLETPPTPDLMQETGRAACDAGVCEQLDIGPSESARIQWKFDKCRAGKC